MSKTWSWFGCVFFMLLCGLNPVVLGQEATELSPNHPRMLALQKQAASLQKSISETRDRLEQTKMKIQILEDQMDQIGQQLLTENVSESSYPEVLMQLQVQRINLTIEKAGLDAKAEKLAELANREQQPNDTTKQKRLKLEELRALEQEGLNRLNELHKQGVVPSSELMEGRKRLIQVDLQLLELESPQTATSKEASWAADLLAKCALEQIEAAAKLAAVNELLQPLQQVRSKLSAIQGLKNEAESWHKQQEQLQTRQMEQENRLLELESLLGREEGDKE